MNTIQTVPFSTLEAFYEDFEGFGPTQGIVPKWVFVKMIGKTGIDDPSFLDHLFKVWDQGMEIHIHIYILNIGYG